MKRFRRIRYKLIVAVLAVLLAALGIVTVVTHQKALSVIREQSGTFNASLAVLGAEQLGMTASQINTIYQSIYLDNGFRSYLKSSARRDEDISPADYADLLQTVFLSKLSSRTDIYSIIYIDLDGRLTYCTRDEAGYYRNCYDCATPESFLRLYESVAGWKDGMIALPTDKHMPLRTKSSDNAPYVYGVARKIVNTESHYEPVGVMYITMDLSGCARMAEAISTDDEPLVYVADYDGNIIFDSTGTHIVGQLPDALMEHIDGSESATALRMDKETFITAYSDVPELNWRVITLVPEGVYVREASSVSNAIVATAVAVLLFAVILAALFSRLLSRPLEHMANAMNRVDSEHLTVRVPVHGQDEVAQMGRSFNALMDRLQAAIENEYLLTIRQKEAILRALQAQLNPHFLYNALQSISSMASLHNVPQIDTIAHSLGCLLRYTIQDASLVSTVREESDHVRHYLAIQKIRFGERLHVQIDIPEHVMEYRLPRVFLQPLVENSIVHGLEARSEQGNLMIGIWLDGEMLHIEVSDDGCGIRPEEMQRLRAQFARNEIPTKAKGIGLANLHSRLCLLYGDRAEIQIETEVGIGTSIIVMLPAERA